MPVLKCTVGVNRNNDVLGNSHTLSWSPPDLSGWHCLLHICIQGVRLLTCESVEDPDTSITASLGNVLVVWFISDAESLSVEGPQSVLVRDFDI